MMGGLAYMTGRPGDPLRAGTSVNDIMGGMFGAIGALGALIQRGITGKGMEVQSALFENNVFLMGQHMLQYAVTGQASGADAGARQPVGGLRRVHRQGRRADLPGGGERRAVADLLRRAGLRRPQGRPGAEDQQRPRPRPPATAGDAARAARPPQRRRARGDLRALGLPFAPIRKPEDLYDDPHLLATGGLADIALPDGERAGQTVKTTLFPITMDGQRLGVRLQPPRFGAHTDELLAGLGYRGDEIETFPARPSSPEANGFPTNHQKETMDRPLTR